MAPTIEYPSDREKEINKKCLQLQLMSSTNVQILPWISIFSCNFCALNFDHEPKILRAETSCDALSEQYPTNRWHPHKNQWPTKCWYFPAFEMGMLIVMEWPRHCIEKSSTQCTATRCTMSLADRWCHWTEFSLKIDCHSLDAVRRLWKMRSNVMVIALVIRFVAGNWFDCVSNGIAMSSWCSVLLAFRFVFAFCPFAW